MTEAYSFPELHHLTDELLARAITSDSSEEQVKDGLRICDLCFRDAEPCAVERIEASYRAIQTGDTKRHIDSPGAGDHGLTIDTLASYVFYRSGKAVGIGGLYRYIEKPQEVWLSRFGVIPEERGLETARLILNFHVELARDFGAERLLLFTGEKNIRAQKFYRKAGFELQDETFRYDGVEELVYSVPL